MRRIWAEKYLEMEPNTAEAEHFALYRSCLSELTGKLTNEARTPFVVPGPLDPTVESSNTLRPYDLGAGSRRNVGGFNVKKRTIRHHCPGRGKEKRALCSTFFSDVAAAVWHAVF